MAKAPRLERNENETVLTVKSRVPDRTHENSERPPRETFKRGGTLDAPQRPGYQRFWAIDNPGEIENLERRWWTKVMKDGKPVTFPAGNGKTHILMEIEEKYYLEDIRLQQTEMDKRTKDIMKVDPSKGEYLPMDRENPLSVDKGYYKDLI